MGRRAGRLAGGVAGAVTVAAGLGLGLLLAVDVDASNSSRISALLLFELEEASSSSAQRPVVFSPCQ